MTDEGLRQTALGLAAHWIQSSVEGGVVEVDERREREALEAAAEAYELRQWQEV